MLLLIFYIVYFRHFIVVMFIIWNISICHFSVFFLLPQVCLASIRPKPRLAPRPPTEPLHLRASLAFNNYAFARLLKNSSPVASLYRNFIVTMGYAKLSTDFSLNQILSLYLP